MPTAGYSCSNRFKNPKGLANSHPDFKPKVALPNYENFLRWTTCRNVYAESVAEKRKDRPTDCGVRELWTNKDKGIKVHDAV